MIETAASEGELICCMYKFYLSSLTLLHMSCSICTVENHCLLLHDNTFINSSKNNALLSYMLRWEEKDNTTRNNKMFGGNCDEYIALQEKVKAQRTEKEGADN